MLKVIRSAFARGIILLGLAVTAEATLIDRGNGLLYDTDLDITWLADANYAMTTGYDTDGKMQWDQAMAWAAQLEYLGFTNWRLPSSLDPDPSCDFLEYTGPGGDGSFFYYNCTGSEMGHLFYDELSGVTDMSTNSATFNEAFFVGLEHLNYWSGTEAVPTDVFPSCASNCVWDFDFKNGVTTGYPKNLQFYAMAVHPGDIGNNDPTITSIAVTAATEDVGYSYTFTASDVDVDNVLTLSAPVLPGWLTFSAGVLSGTPLNAQVGDHAVTLRVNDGTVDVDQAFTITVTNANDAPTITSTAVTAATENVGYSYTFTASDVDVGDALTLSAPVLPGWLTFSAGVLSGTPLNAQVGDHAVTLRVNDGTVDVDQAFTITVAEANVAPTVTSIAVTAATEDVGYSYTFTASDANVGDTLTLSAPVLPGWLTFSAGVLSGTPLNAQVGDHAVTLRVNDGTVDVDQAFTITVTNANDAPTITSTAVTAATENVGYSYTFTASDVDVGDALTLSAPVLPGWLTFSAGVLSGTPLNAQVGDHAVTLRVNDGTVDVDQAFTITVAEANVAPTITSTAVTAATEDVGYSYTFTASDADVGDTLTLSAPVLPGWLTFSAGVLSGTPLNAQVGDHAVTLRVNDGTVDVDQAFTITVTAEANVAPTVTSIAVTAATENVGYSYTFTASDANVGDTLTLSAPVLPGWLTFSAGVLSGTPLNAQVGDHAVTLRVNDGTVDVDQAFTITVAEANVAPTITSTAVTAATENVGYSYTFTASDADVGDTLTLSAPVLPGWLTFSAGVLSGTPLNAQVGDHAVTLRVNDGTVDVDQAFTITVTAEANVAPTVTSIAVTEATEDVGYSYTFTASDANVGDTLTLSAPVLPGWLTFSAGVLSGTPLNAQVGDHAVTLRVNDGTVDVDQAFTITVTNANDAPTITSTAVTAATENVGYSYTFTASDVDVGDTLTLSAPVLPGWLTFSAGVLSGTPLNAQVGDHAVTLRVNDGTVDVDQAFTITVTAEANVAPTITSTAVTAATEDVGYSYTFTASDADVGDTLTLSAPVLPGWLTFSAGVLSGTPLNAQVGDHAVTLRVNDGTVDVDQAFTITVTAEANVAPTVTSIAVTEATEDVGYSYTFTASDANVGDTLTLSAPVLPGWLTFSAGVLSGTPLNAQVGDHAVTLRVNDGTVDVDQAFTITVTAEANVAPTVTSIAVTEATEDVGYSYTFTASDANVGDTLTLSAPVLPGWLTFSAGVLSGTPLNAQVGDHAVTLRVNDGTVDVDQAFTITVTAAPNVAPTANAGLNQAIVVGTTVTLNGAGSSDSDGTIGSNAYAWTQTAGTTVSLANAATAGPSFTAPGAAGTLSFSLVVTDNEGAASTNLSSVTITVTAGNLAPLVILEADQGSGTTHIVSQTNGDVTVTAVVTDPNSGDTHTYNWSATDNALVDIDGDIADGVFSFNPLNLPNPGFYTLRVVVNDGSIEVDAELMLRVIAVEPVLSTTVDRDNDGIVDAVEGYGDDDNDGVPNYLDAITLANVLQGQSASSVQYLLQTESGLNLALGLVAFQANRSQAVVSSADIVNYNGTAADELPNVGGLFDFVVTGLPEAGQSIRVVLPQLEFIPVDAVYRKLMPTGWQDFVENSRNTLSSAHGVSTYCPPPGDSAYTPGLTEGHSCVQLFIEDGGPNDADIRVNRRVVDPGGLVQLQNVVSVKSSGGAIYSSLVLLILWRLWFRLRRKVRETHGQNHPCSYAGITQRISTGRTLAGRR